MSTWSRLVMSRTAHPEHQLADSPGWDTLGSERQTKNLISSMSQSTISFQLAMIPNLTLRHTGVDLPAVAGHVGSIQTPT